MHRRREGVDEVVGVVDITGAINDNATTRYCTGAVMAEQGHRVRRLRLEDNELGVEILPDLREGQQRADRRPLRRGRAVVILQSSGLR